MDYSFVIKIHTKQEIAHTNWYFWNGKKLLQWSNRPVTICNIMMFDLYYIDDTLIYLFDVYWVKSVNWLNIIIRLCYLHH